MCITVPLLYSIYFAIYLTKKLKKSPFSNPKVDFENNTP